MIRIVNNGKSIGPFLLILILLESIYMFAVNEDVVAPCNETFVEIPISHGRFLFQRTSVGLQIIEAVGG